MRYINKVDISSRDRCGLVSIKPASLGFVCQLRYQLNQQPRCVYEKVNVLLRVFWLESQHCSPSMSSLLTFVNCDPTARLVPQVTLFSNGHARSLGVGAERGTRVRDMLRIIFRRLGVLIRLCRMELLRYIDVMT